LKEETMRGTQLRFASIAVALVAAVLVAVWGAGVARAIVVVDGKVDLGPVGLARGQVARLTVASISNPEQLPPPAPCRVGLRFLDGAGRVLREARADLAPGASAALDLAISNAEDFPLDRYSRLALRAQARVIGDPGIVPPGACRSLVSLELFDAANGRTAVFVPGGTPALVQPPEPD
jgi:hypothetical protein